MRARMLVLASSCLFCGCSSGSSSSSMDAGHSSDASTLPPLDGGVIDPGPASPAPLGAEWIAVGDSETDGRAEGSVLSQIIAFETVWNGTGELGAAPSLTIDGESGRALRASGFAYHGGTYDNCTGTGGDDQTIAGMGHRGAATWVHFQESGNQNNCGETTREEFGDTFEALVRRIRVDSPNAVISTETAYSFEREAMQGRDWSAYNDELRERVAVLAADGITVHVAEVDAYMKMLVAELGFDTVMTEDGGHFRGVGNLLVAMAMFEALGYDVRALDVSAAVEVGSAHRSLVVDIVADR